MIFWWASEDLKKERRGNYIYFIININELNCCSNILKFNDGFMEFKITHMHEIYLWKRTFRQNGTHSRSIKSSTSKNIKNMKQRDVEKFCHRVLWFKLQFSLLISLIKSCFCIFHLSKRKVFFTLLLLRMLIYHIFKDFGGVSWSFLKMRNFTFNLNEFSHRF
jgi:hypothetical protein